MKYLLLSALVLSSSSIFAQFVKKSPLNESQLFDVFTNRVSFQRVDRENGIYYYESKPVSYASDLGGSGGEIILQPVISVAGISGETQFHLWVTYHPPLSPAGGTSFIRPKYLSFLTARQKVTLPLLYYHTTAEIPAGTPVSGLAPGTPSPLGESAYAVLTPEDLSGLAAIALEGINDIAVEAWEPTVVQKFQENTKARATANPDAAVRKRSISDYLDFQKNIGSSNTDYRSLNWGQFQPIMPPMADQRAVSLMLYGDSTHGVDTVQERLIPIIEMMDLYQALSNRSITMP